MRNLFTFILCFIGTIAISQNKQILYGFNEIPQSLMVNPGGEVEQKMHIGIPLLSQIHINIGSSGVTIHDIFQEGNGDINDRIRNTVHQMNNSDFLTSTAQLGLIDFGWKSRNDTYFSGGIYHEMDFIVYFPKDIVILGLEGNKDYIGNTFNLGEIGATGDISTVYYFGFNKQINKNFTVGSRLKLYSSALSFRSINNTGRFVTEEGQDNIYRHTIQNADLTLNTAGYNPINESGEKLQINKLIAPSFLGANLGVGLDLGFSYRVNDNLKISASALDIGVVFNSKDVESYHGYGSYSLEGINLLFPPLDEGEQTIPYYDNLEDDIDQQFKIDELHASYVQFKPIKLNAGFSYGFGRYYGYKGCNYLRMADRKYFKHNVGLHLYSIFRPKAPQTAATIFYKRKITDFLSAKITYTADPFSYTNVGVGFSANWGITNFYVTADNFLKYGNLAKAKNISLQLGLNIKT